MLVRNRTRVPLRVELYQPKGASLGSPWADCLLFQKLAMVDPFGVFATGNPKPVMVADVAPGIEWALRPRARDGRRFQMKLLSQHGVVVCSKQLSRGQTFDFRVQVPQRNPGSAVQKRLKAAVAQRAGHEAIDEPAAASVDKPALDEPAESICSTRAPSSQPRSSADSLALGRTSLLSLAYPAFPLDLAEMPEELEPALAGSSRLPPPEAKAAVDQEASTKTQKNDVLLDTTICPRCLREIVARFTRPAAPIYAAGVQCDHCNAEMVRPGNSMMNDPDSCFFHCGRCWFDLCHNCALREMKEVWWASESEGHPPNGCVPRGAESD